VDFLVYAALVLRRAPNRPWTPRGPFPLSMLGILRGIEVLIVGIVAAIVIAVIVIPLLLFGVELIVAGLLVAGSIVARSALGRPWIVHATPSADPTGTLAWEVKGWQRSGELIETVAAELAAGLTPSPTEDSERVTSGSS
jgi:hypothetical protein